MATRDEEDEKERDDDAPEAGDDGAGDEGDDADERDASGSSDAAGDEPEDDGSEDDGDERDASEDDGDERDASEDDEPEEKAETSLAARGESDLDAAPDQEGAEGALPTQLGSQRYVFASFFAAGMLLAYVLGRAIHGTWAHVSNRDFFALNAPTLAAVPDDSKLTYSMLFAGIVAVVAVVRTSRKPDVRQWSEEVSTELVKVKWPTRKEVQSSTIVVIATSVVATTYLFLLDQFWSFVTNLIYGTGT